MFIGHRSEDGREQLLIDHLKNTELYAGEFADKFGAKKFGEILGRYHDIGKYSVGFQKRVRGNGLKVDHSTAGAIEVWHAKLHLLAFCIAGHHGGLPNGGANVDTADDITLWGRIKRKDAGKLDSYKDFLLEVGFLTEKPILRDINVMNTPYFGASFMTRMLFSCLVDADFLDTEAFMNNNANIRGKFDDIPTLCCRMKNYIKQFWPPQNKLNEKRCQILTNCLDKADDKEGLYSLTVPTGAGKTIASLAFALKHAKKYKKNRIIYVIPYTSIIEQNAQVFSEILGEKNIIEHHINVSYDSVEEQEDPNFIKKLATENWDAPIIVTTNVQFFESLYSNKPSKCRKLHNIANSVVIFDEAQMFPLGYLKPCVRAIADLVVNYGVTAVLCSATQPTLDKFFPLPLMSKEICVETEELYKCFQRVCYEQIGKISIDELSVMLNKEKQVLCIVNTKKEAQLIFEKLKGDNCFHLSTFMYPEHRKRTLKKIRECLLNKSDCRVISTSLIEAGVDVDFPIVYRALTGLDSIIQAGGRCNREGKRNIDESKVIVFKLVDDNGKIMRENNSQEKEVASIVVESNEDISSPKAIGEYFNKLYSIKGNSLDYKGILPEISSGSFPFKDIANKFVMIPDDSISIFIPIEDKAKKLEQQLRYGQYNRTLLRKIGKYIVNVHKCDYERLFNAYKIQKLDDSITVLLDTSMYDVETGLKIKIHNGDGIFA